MNEKEVAAFIADYNSTLHEQISFAWNHKHADDFHDANDVLRQQVIDAVLENQDTASLDLIADLFEAEANWSKEAWCIRDSFSELGSTLLNRGGIERIDSFLESFAQSFDSWSACHVMRLNSTTIESFIEELKKRLLQTDDERVKKPAYTGSRII